MRAVLDPNVIISAILSPVGTPAEIVREWLDGGFELVVSPLLIAELERAFSYPKLRKRIARDDAAAVVDWLGRGATVAQDPVSPPPVRSPDPADDYLIGLAAAESALLVSGDAHLLSLAEQIPVLSPAAFLDRLRS